MALTRGNAAKLYCLRALDTLARERSELRIVDLGAGTAANAVALLRAHPHVRYVAVEPDEAACRAAERNLAGLAAEVVRAQAYDVEVGPADAVVSFSVLEHVYDRDAYFRCIARHLGPGARAWMNYDSGHFTRPGARDRVKTALGPVFARLGQEQWFQAFVRESELRKLAATAGLEIAEAKSFNTDLKLLYRLVPEERQEAFTERWLELELAANELLPTYEDAHARYFMTRNVVLRRVGDPGFEPGTSALSERRSNQLS